MNGIEKATALIALALFSGCGEPAATNDGCEGHLEFLLDLPYAPLPERGESQCLTGWGHDIPAVQPEWDEALDVLDQGTGVAVNIERVLPTDGGGVVAFGHIVQAVEEHEFTTVSWMARYDANGLVWVRQLPDLPLVDLATAGSGLIGVGAGDGEERPIYEFSGAGELVGETVGSAPYAWIVEDPTGGHWLAAPSTGEFALILDHRDASGTYETRASLETSGAGFEMKAMPDGGLLAAYEETVVVMGPDGDLRWEKASGSTEGLAVSDSGNILIARRDVHMNGSDIFLVAIDASGETMWSQTYRREDITKDDAFNTVNMVNDLSPGPEGSFILSGMVSRNSGDTQGQWQPFVMGVGADGSANWGHIVGVTGQAKTTVLVGEGAALVFGQTFSSGEPTLEQADQVSWVRKLNL